MPIPFLCRLADISNQFSLRFLHYPTFYDRICIMLDFKSFFNFTFVCRLTTAIASLRKGIENLRKLRYIFFTMLCFCLLLGNPANLVPKAHAVSQMAASEACVEFIKEIEGFSYRPYYDYGQHTVGYGTKCPTEKYFDYWVNGIPKDEAETLLRETVADIENTIHERLIRPYGLTFTQYQFDALVSFSFNLGTGWMSYDSTLRNAILRNANEEELIYAFSLYSTAGGTYSPGLVTRRLCEANIYLNGVYSQYPNEAYGYVFYEPNGGNLTYRVQGFVCENKSAPMADAVRNGDIFLGWYTDLTGGYPVNELTGALAGKTLFARWQSSENAENQGALSTLITVTGDVVNIRKGPGTNYGISKQVYRHDIMLVSHVTHLSNRKWGKVQDGWICLDYTNYDAVINGSVNPDPENNSQPSDTVPDRPPASGDTQLNTEITPGNSAVILGIVRVNDLLRIRSGPGTTYSTVGYLFNGQAVEILEQKTADSMVWGRMTRGWISMDYIVTDTHHMDSTIEPDTKPNQEIAPEQIPTEPVTKPESTAMRGKIIADALRIRSGPGTENPIVGFYYQNDMVTVSETVLVQSVYWGKTEKGWIHMDYVLTDSPNKEVSPAPEIGVKTIIADCLRVRKTIGTDSRIAALLYYGDTITVYETKTVDGTVWGKVSNGWVCMDYVK